MLPLHEYQVIENVSTTISKGRTCLFPKYLLIMCQVLGTREDTKNMQDPA